MVTIYSVLRGGGVYDEDDVYNLMRHIDENTTLDYAFECISDVGSVSTMPIELGLPKWWTKIELFKNTGPSIFLDLDTAIFKNIDELIKWAESASSSILMLKPFHKKRRPRYGINDHASGVMAWSGDFSYIYTEFIESDMLLKGDQIYIEKKLKEHGADLGYVNEVVDGIRSYKWHCRKMIPEDTSICCFHGNPRPRKVGYPFWVDPRYLDQYKKELTTKRQNSIRRV